MVMSRSEAASIAGLTLHAKHDSRAIAERARRGLDARFEREVDPEGVLPVEERRARAARLRTAHMRRLAARSAEARRARKVAAA